MEFGEGAFTRQWGLDEDTRGGLSRWLKALRRRFCLCPVREDTVRGSSQNLTCRDPDLWLPASTTVRNKFPLFKPTNSVGILLWPPQRTNARGTLGTALGARDPMLSTGTWQPQHCPRGRIRQTELQMGIKRRLRTDCLEEKGRPYTGESANINMRAWSNNVISISLDRK